MTFLMFCFACSVVRVHNNLRNYKVFYQLACLLWHFWECFATTFREIAGYDLIRQDLYVLIMRIM